MRAFTDIDSRNIPIEMQTKSPIGIPPGSTGFLTVEENRACTVSADADRIVLPIRHAHGLPGRGKGRWMFILDLVIVMNVVVVVLFYVLWA